MERLVDRITPSRAENQPQVRNQNIMRPQVTQNHIREQKGANISKQSSDLLFQREFLRRRSPRKKIIILDVLMITKRNRLSLRRSIIFFLGDEQKRTTLTFVIQQFIKRLITMQQQIFKGGTITEVRLFVLILHHKRHYSATC